MKSQFVKASILLVLLTVLSAVPAFAKKVTLSWDASPSEVTGYKVYYDTQSDTAFEGIDAIEGDSPIDVGNVLTYTVTGLYDDEDYYFAVTAYDASGNESTYSNIVASSSTSATPTENNAPVLSSIGAKVVSEGATLTFTAAATDADNDNLVYSATNLPGDASFSNGSFSWSPDYTSAGTYSVTITVSDGTDSASETVSITVNDVNRAPVLASIGSQSVSEGSALSFSVSASDSDNDTLTYSASNLPNGASFVSANRYFSWTPGSDAAGSYQVTVTVSDGSASDSETVTITVANVNVAPVLAAVGSQNVSEGSTLSFNLNASDSDNDNLTYSANNLPAGAALSSAGNFSWNPDYTSSGTYSVTFSVSDGSATDSEVVTIVVANVNRIPVLSSIGTQSVAEGSSLSFTISASDADGDNLIYSASGLPDGAVFNSTSHTFSWTPEYADTKNTRIYPVAFTVSDGSATDSETVTINVTNVNRAPVMDTISAQSILANNAFSLSISASDPDSNALTYSVSALPSGATFNAESAVFSWTPSADQAGTYQVVFSVSDGNLSASQTVNMTVTFNNSAPIISGTPDSTIMATYHYAFTPTASDVDSDQLTFSISNKPSWASFDTTSGRLYGSPSEFQTGTYGNIVISVSDGSLATSLAAFSVNVTAYIPVDTDLDGIPDSQDAFPNDSAEWQDTDGDNIGNVADADDDNDGILDQYDSAPLDSSVSDWTVYAVAEEGGYITPDGDSYHAYGSSQSYELMPQAGYYISNLLVNGVSVGAVTAFDLTGISQNYELVAEFEEIPVGLSLDNIHIGLPGVDRVDGGDDSNNYVDGVPKLALDYQFSVVFRATDITADSRIVYLVLDGYKYPMTLTSGTLANGAEYTVETRLGPAYAHNFYFLAEDLSGNEVSRYPEQSDLAGPQVELLDGRNVVAISADVDAYGLDSLAAFADKQVQVYLPERDQYKLADSVAPIATGMGYVIKRATNTSIPDLSSYGEIADEVVEIPVQTGWNLIGNPYGGRVSLADIDVQVGNNVAVPWLNAVDANIVVDGIYSYLGEDWGGTNEFSAASGTTPAQLIPWIGYWVYINPSDSPVTLLIPKPLQ